MKSVELLISAYNKQDEMQIIEEKRKNIEKIKTLYTEKGYVDRLEKVKKTKTHKEASIEEKFKSISIYEDFELYEVQYKTYRDIENDIISYDKKINQMNRELKKIKSKYSEIKKMLLSFENMSIEWS